MENGARKAGYTLKTAVEIVAWPRAQNYGCMVKSATHIAELWSAYLGHKIEPWEAMQMMALLKISRDKNGGYHADNAIDQAGYAAIAGQVRGHYADKS